MPRVRLKLGWTVERDVVAPIIKSMADKPDDEADPAIVPDGYNNVKNGGGQRQRRMARQGSSKRLHNSHAEQAVIAAFCDYCTPQLDKLRISP